MSSINFSCSNGNNLIYCLLELCLNQSKNQVWLLIVAVFESENEKIGLLAAI